jgi:PPOX class probable F420-dependent enzyme
MFISSRCASQTSLPSRTGTSQPGQPHGTMVSGLSVGSEPVTSSIGLSGESRAQLVGSKPGASAMQHAMTVAANESEIPQLRGGRPDDLGQRYDMVGFHVALADVSVLQAEVKAADFACESPVAPESGCLLLLAEGVVPFPNSMLAISDATLLGFVLSLFRSSWSVALRSPSPQRSSEHRQVVRPVVEQVPGFTVSFAPGPQPGAWVLRIQRSEVGQLHRDPVRVSELLRVGPHGVDRQGVEYLAELNDLCVGVAQESWPVLQVKVKAVSTASTRRNPRQRPGRSLCAKCSCAPRSGARPRALAFGAMELHEALKLITQHHRAVLATTRRDGNPQLSLVAAAVDGNTVVVSTRETANKTKNLQRRPRASLLAFTDAFYGDWVQVEGAVEVVPLPEAMDGLIAYYRQVAGEHPDWDEYRAAMERERRVLLRITIERAGPDTAG